MNTFHKNHTEPIFNRLTEYRTKLAAHPFLLAAQKAELPECILHEFAYHQYSDSILWIPMLAQMKSKAIRSDRLRRAIEENIHHEAGLSCHGNTTISHVSLAVQLMRSLGMFNLNALPIETFANSASLWLSDDFANFNEPEVAGFLLTAETLVPLMFSLVVKAFDTLECNTNYFHEHISVDGDEHAVWMAESIEDVVKIYGSESVESIMSGMNDAWDESVEIPNVLWSKIAS